MVEDTVVFSLNYENLFEQLMHRPYLTAALLATVFVLVGLLFKDKKPRSVSELLNALPQDSYTVFNDILINSHQGTFRLEYIVVSRHGLFVINEKQETGAISGQPTDQYWVESKGSANNKFYNPIRQIHVQIKSLEVLLPPLSRLPLVPVAVFPDKARFLTAINGVVHFRELINEIKKHDRNLLTSAEVSVVVAAINRANITDGIGYRN